MTYPSEETIEHLLSDWPDYSRKTGERLIEKYGRPDEVTDHRLVWHDNGPWKRTILHREGPRHEFPVPHRDYLEQYVDYDVPPETFDDLARFDGSVYPDRTKGELGASCHQEGANVLSVNLAHDIVTGRTTVEEARDEYAKIMTADKAGSEAEYMRELQFEPPGKAGDPDVTIATDKVRRSPGKLGLAGLAVGAFVYYVLRRRRGSRRRRQH